MRALKFKQTLRQTRNGVSSSSPLNPSKFQFYPSILNLFISTRKKKKNPMLELHTKLHALTPALASNLRPGSANSASPFLRAVLSSLRGLTRRSSRSSDLVGHRAFFCSDSDSSGDVVVHVEAKALDSEAEEVETKSSSAIVSTNPRPEDYLTVSFILFIFFNLWVLSIKF